MSGKFEGTIHESIPCQFELRDKLSHEVLKVLEVARDLPFKYVVHPQYSCTEFKIKLNIFSFGKLKCNLPVTVIAPPVSIDCCGYNGDLKALIDDYKNRNGWFLVLNLKEPPALDAQSAAVAETLSSCHFFNSFRSFEEYLSALRSPYRRRLVLALRKGKSLTVEKIENHSFSEELYTLYLKILKHSKFPLETLRIDFFRKFTGDIFVFYHLQKPLAFIAVQTHAEELNFILGGMDYACRDPFDLYYNMLLFIIRLGIEEGVPNINFGQTAEQSKLRIGCFLEARYMVAFSGNNFLHWLLKISSSRLGYVKPKEKYHCFHTRTH